MKRVLHAVLVTACLSGILPAKAFDKIYTFGDSISDGGFAGNDTRFISGYTSKLYSEIISGAYTGQELLPYTQGGTNYAQAGSTAGFTLLPLYKTAWQIENYLASHQQQADKNGLYFLWIGGNDISFNVQSSVLKLNFGTLLDQGKHYLLSDAPANVVSQAKTLLDAGAGMLVVPNLPNAGMSPWTGTALFGFAQAFLGGNLLDLFGLYATQDTYLRSLGSVQGEEARQSAVIDSVADVLASRGITVPREITASVFRWFLNTENMLTEQFNNDVEQGLSQLNGNIVYADVNHLFNEIIESPKTYGFDNILVPICGIGTGAPVCNEDTENFHNDQVYLFSDWFHPSPAAHEVLAQYMMSIVDAPLLVSSLQQGILNVQSDRRLYMDAQLQTLRAPGAGEKVTVFGGYSGKYAKVRDNISSFNGHGFASNALLGFAIQPVEGFLLGGTYSTGYNRYQSASLFKYNYGSTIMGVFSQLKMANGLWGNVDFSSGSVNFHNITRQIRLGSALRNEKGNSHGRFSGVAVNTGYDFQLNRYLTTGPVLGYSYDRARINGYQEQANSSTSMRFGGQKVNRRQFTAGWRIEATGLLMNPYLELAYRHENISATPGIRAALKSTGTSFYRADAGKTTSEWLETRLGINSALTKNLGVHAVVNLSSGNGGNSGINYATGLNYSF